MKKIICRGLDIHMFMKTQPIYKLGIYSENSYSDGLYRVYCLIYRSDCEWVTPVSDYFYADVNNNLQLSKIKFYIKGYEEKKNL